ncbi:single-strand binding protein family [Trichophaea hybrida]|nr:single-strand binding protein family [Trichophaea hybrida]
MFSTRSLISATPALARAFSSTPRAAIAKVTIVGRLAADVEFVTTASGTEIAKYTVGSRYKQGGEDKVSWFRVASFDEHTKNYLHGLKKGTLVYLEGSLRTNTYEGDDGKSHIVYNITQR